ncbi:hemicentin-1-like protein, partial [Dinothrombium tinctorium]
MLPTQTLSEGVTFNALCSVLKGSKPLHFSWLKDGLTLQKDGKDIKIETSSVASTLFFEKVTRTDSGNYTCVVTNSLGEDRKSFLLTVKVSLHWIEAPEDVTFLEGRDVYINCNAEGFPKPQIKWKKNAREVLTNKERMEIRNIKIEDAGNYECIAENGVDEVLSKKFRIIVAASDCSVAPKVVPFPLFSPFNENRPFAVLCTVQDGSFPLKFQWFKDNKPIDKQRENIEIETTESNSNLRIRQLKQNHSGNYTCSVRNAYGTDSQTVSLLVKAPLMWSKEPKDIGVRVNSDVDVECFATGIPFPKISWKRNGNQSNVKKHLIVIIEAGTYECVADNGIASPLVKSIKISVYGKRMKTTAFRIIATQEAPKILPSLPLLSLSAGSRFVTMCTISQGTSPIYFKWNKNGKQVDLKKINIKTEEITSTLTIDKVTREDSGNYSCTAENAFGKDTRIIQLMVKIPLVWKIEPQNMIIVESKSLELVCDADGIPAPKISWFKKETNTFVSERSKLRIEKVTKSSEGDYECIADNGVDAPLKKRVKVMVVDSPKLLPLSNLPPLNEGSIFMSLCAIQQGSVPLKFKWLKDGKPLITDANVNIESNDLSSTLRIHSVKLTNAGNYTCIVKNSLGEDRQTTSLIVKASVRWIKEPRDLRLNLDENGFLECKAFGIPSPRITWMYNDKVLESNIERLSIKGISKSSGKYECIADNGVDPPLRKSVHVLITAKSGACVYTIYSISIQSDNSVNMSKILLYVTVFVAIKFTFASKAPKLLPIPALTPINEGSSFRLFCVVSEGSSPLIFNWKKNGFNLINENEIETTDRDSTLKIKEMKPLLNGNYTCEVTNNFGKDSQTTTVIVKAPLKWVKEPKDLNLILKEDGLIECEVSGVPSPKVKWIKNGKELSNLNENLRITQASIDDEGEYECVAENGMDVTLRKVIKVSVKDSPKIIPMPVLPPFTEGARFAIFCTIQKGMEPLRFEWFKNKEKITDLMPNIQTETSKMVSMLTIQNVKREDAANYTCVVQNVFGKDSQTIALSVKAAPKWLKEPESANVITGGDIALYCEADGFPLPAIRWMKGDTELSNEKQLNLKRVSSSDSGSYKCIAENGHDTPLVKVISVTVF